MMKDHLQKDLLCRHYAAQNAYVQPEVIVFHRGGIHERKKVITDVDVIALRPSLDLRWDLTLCDCKTLKGVSPANRVLWLRGLMDHFGANSGIVMLQKRQNIETDHKLFAASLGITLLDEEEFSRYDKAMVYPEGTSRFPISVNSIQDFQSIANRYHKLSAFCEYLYATSWNEDNKIDLLRTVIGETQSVSREIDPAKQEHLALVLDAVGIFAIGLAECIGTIFNQCLQPDTVTKLDDALKIVIWGGRARYDFIATLRKDVLKSRGQKPGPEGALALPNWNLFLHLVRNMLENPRLSFAIPQIMRRSALNVYNAQKFLQHTKYEDLLLLKFAMLTTEYFCTATKLPAQMRQALADMFLKRQSDILSPVDNAVLILGDGNEKSEANSSRDPIINDDNETFVQASIDEDSDSKTKTSQE
jgi:hypothetical protein